MIDPPHMVATEPPLIVTAPRAGYYSVDAVADVIETTTAKLKAAGETIGKGFRRPPEDSWGLIGWRGKLAKLGKGDSLEFELVPPPPDGRPVALTATWIGELDSKASAG